jgi:hypothetical protein
MKKHYKKDTSFVTIGDSIKCIIVGNVGGTPSLDRLMRSTRDLQQVPGGSQSL